MSNGDTTEDYRSVELTWNNLNCVVTSSKDASVEVKLLKDVSGYARSGHITSIMGPSGAGKTMTMDILAGRVTSSKLRISGDLLVNGKSCDMKLFAKSMSYVMQQDYLPITETVRECLNFNAALRLPQSMSHAEKHKRAEATMQELELITSPSCIFLDEPTSGLDSEIAVTIMNTLHSLAAAGRTILLTIHQPNSDITELFDDFILMARGRVVYAGAWSDAVGFFERAGYTCPRFKNPTDYFMRVVSNDDDAQEHLVAQQVARWESTKRIAFTATAVPDEVLASTDDEVTVSMGKGDEKMSVLATLDKRGDKATASVVSQTYYLALRNFRMWRRHPMMLVGEGVQYIVLALFVGGMYFDLSDQLELGTFERQAALFYILVTIIFTPPFTAVTVYQNERGLLRREINQHTYTLTAFYVSKTLTLLPMETLGALAVSIISYFMFGLQREAAKFFIYFLTMLLALLVSESLGLLFAMITKTGEMAIILMSIIFIVIISFTGFLVRDTPVYYEWIEYISYVRYASAAMYMNEMEGLTLYDEDGTPVAGEEVQQGSSLDTGLALWENIAVLFGFLVFLRLAGLLGLHIAHRRGWL